MNWLNFWFLCLLILCLEARKDHLTFQLNDLAKQLTGKEIVCNKEGQIISLPEATNGTFQSNCFQCVCRNRNLICSRKLCPPIPSNCPLTIQSPQDECCLECAYCVDEWNQRRENGALWPSRSGGKCSRFVCESGIKTLSQMYCVNSCSADIGIESHSYCCRLCPIQVTQDPSLRISDDPCVRCETVGGFWQQCYRLACPVLNCPSDQQKRSHRHCCPRCAKKRELTQVASSSGLTCQFQHSTYIRGQRFRPDACSQCECTAIGLECRRYVCPVECPGGYYRPQVCCPFCGHLRNQTKYILPNQLNVHSQCIIQLNATRMIWKENDHWSPDACTTCSCVRGQVTCQTKVCPKVECDPEKQRKVVPVGQCCAQCLELKKHQKGGICKLSPNSQHLRTFDGTAIDIQPPCTYILTQQCIFDGELPTFVLRSHQNTGGQLQKLSLELNEKSNVRLGILNIVKGKELKYRGRRIKLPQSTRVFNATYEKQRLTIDLHSMGLKLVWLKAKGVRLYADRRHNGHLCGLCGNFNGVSSDDLLPRFAMNLTLDSNIFVQSWQNEGSECRMNNQAKTDEFDEISEIEEQSDSEPKTNKQRPTKMPKSSCQRLIHSKAHKEERRRFGRNCSKLKRSPFLGACLAQIRVNSFMRQCMTDVCGCEQKRGDRTEKSKDPCYCASMNAYVMECAQNGLLTLGTYAHSTNSSIRIHGKCPAIDIERV